ncbi:MAG: ribulose bisphosphate carboxylase small subunit [Chromatiales bacterium]|nr:ribulose bisphosphate carboxylase small subunit [Gammaproteobacteria bacterium]MCP5352306.1 ribulose bisphosphate carboxylase small subunit [Chromatiales bacterium]
MQASLRQPETPFQHKPTHADPTHADPTRARVFAQIEHCLTDGVVRQGCVIRIEHTSTMAPRYSPWQTWGTPVCFNGDSQQIHDQLAACEAAHGDHHIRLSIEDYSCHSRFSFVVHKPLAAAA